MEINNTQNITEMDSLEDLVSYLQSIDKVESTPIEETINISKVSKSIPNNTIGFDSNKRSSTVSDHHLFNWYNPFAVFDGVTLLCWNNVYIVYSYKIVNSKSRFVLIDSVKLQVDGCYVLGFEVKGFCIGEKIVVHGYVH